MFPILVTTKYAIFRKSANRRFNICKRNNQTFSMSNMSYPATYTNWNSIFVMYIKLSTAFMFGVTTGDYRRSPRRICFSYCLQNNISKTISREPLRSSRPEVFFKKRCSQKFCKIHRNTPVSSLIKLEVIKKETLAQVFSCEFCKISRNTFSYRSRGP